MTKKPPTEVVRLLADLESKLEIKLFIVKGRRNTFGWFFSTLPEDKIGLRDYRWLLPSQEIKVTRAYRMVNGNDCCYLFFDDSSNLKEETIEIDGKKVVKINIKKLKENIEIFLLNAHLFYIKNKDSNVKFDPEYIKRAETVLKSLTASEEEKLQPSVSEETESGTLPPEPFDEEIIQNKKKGIFIKKSELADVFKNADSMMKVDILNTIFEDVVSDENISYKNIQKLQEEYPKLILQRKRLLEHLEDLKEFEKRINDEKTLEEDLQKFLENHTWVFGEEYSGALESKENIGSNSDINKPDFVLKDVARKKDAIIFSPNIFELKRASAEFAKQDSRKKDELAPRSSVLDAIWQGFRYVETMLKKGIYSKVFIIIGRHGGDKAKQKILKRLNFHLPNIQLVTYDELLSRARKRIKYYLAENE